MTNTGLRLRDMSGNVIFDNTYRYMRVLFNSIIEGDYDFLIPEEYRQGVELAFWSTQNMDLYYDSEDGWYRSLHYGHDTIRDGNYIRFIDNNATNEKSKAHVIAYT